MDEQQLLALKEQALCVYQQVKALIITIDMHLPNKPAQAPAPRTGPQWHGKDEEEQ